MTGLHDGLTALHSPKVGLQMKSKCEKAFSELKIFTLIALAQSMPYLLKGVANVHLLSIEMYLNDLSSLKRRPHLLERKISNQSFREGSFNELIQLCTTDFGQGWFTAFGLFFGSYFRSLWFLGNRFNSTMLCSYDQLGDDGEEKSQIAADAFTIKQFWWVKDSVGQTYSTATEKRPLSWGSRA